MEIETTLLPIIKVSTNEIYAGVHWRKRRKIKQDYLLVTRSKIRSIPKIEGKVNLSFSFYFKSRPLDSSNCSFMAKMIEDCLVGNGILKDDSIKHVGKISIESYKGTEDYCKMKIESA